MNTVQVPLPRSRKRYFFCLGLTCCCSQDDSTHQLEDGHPAKRRDLDEANEHHFIRGDIALSDNPIRRRSLDRDALAVLKKQTSRSNSIRVHFWGRTHQQKLFYATSHNLDERLEGNGIPNGSLVPQLDLMFGERIARPLRSYTHG